MIFPLITLCEDPVSVCIKNDSLKQTIPSSFQKGSRGVWTAATVFQKEPVQCSKICCPRRTSSLARKTALFDDDDKNVRRKKRKLQLIAGDWIVIEKFFEKCGCKLYRTSPWIPRPNRCRRPYFIIWKSQRWPHLTFATAVPLRGAAGADKLGHLLVAALTLGHFAVGRRRRRRRRPTAAAVGTTTGGAGRRRRRSSAATVILNGTAATTTSIGLSNELTRMNVWCSTFFLINNEIPIS